MKKNKSEVDTLDRYFEVIVALSLEDQRNNNNDDHNDMKMLNQGKITSGE